MTQCGGVYIWHVTIFHIKSGLDVSTQKPELELIFFSSNDRMSPVANERLQQMYRAEAIALDESLQKSFLHSKGGG